MQIALNIITNILVILLSIVFNFFITPLYIHELGLEVYGYIGVITNFISFLSVITTVLNSMVGRFYSIYINREKRLIANSYISTAFYVGVGLDVLILPIILFITFNLENFISIAPAYLNDVKIAFLLTAIAFLMTVISLVNMTGAYALNRLDINNNIRLVMIMIRFAVIIGLFHLFKAKVYFLGISLIVENLFCLLATYITFKKLVPDLKYNIRQFSKDKMGELLGAGFFNSIVLLGDLLMSQILMIVANHTITAKQVGVLGSIVVIINGVKSIAAAISSAFSPETLRLYAEDRIDELIENTMTALAIIGTIVGWIISIFCIMDTNFFYLWIGNDFSQYHVAIIAFSIPMISILSTAQFHVVLQALNKLIAYSLVTIICGILSIFAMLFFGRYCDLGMLGLIIGCNLMAFVQHVIVLPSFVHRYLANSVWRMYRNLSLPQIYGIVFYLIFRHINYFFPEKSLFTFISEGAILSIIFWGIIWVLSPAKYKRIVYSLLMKFLNRTRSI